ncbi:MAG TPA: hypothetical protein VHZ97_05720 [Pseudonocardiaceae bacterium]|nr:hypothetical protein [Pseudonocardiaceae bacterium]
MDPPQHTRLRGLVSKAFTAHRVEALRPRTQQIVADLHHCLGAAPARMEMQVSLATLLRRLSGLRLAVPVDEVAWRPGTLARGVAALPVIW